MKKEFNFDFEKNEFVMKNGSPELLSGRAALIKWVEKSVRSKSYIEMYRRTGYGNQIEDIAVGSVLDAGFSRAELERELRGSLERNADIISIPNISIEQSNDTLVITIHINSIYGNVEVNYSYDG